MTNGIHSHPPSWWHRFLWSVAGAHVPFLKEDRCAIDRPKYGSIGAAVLMTAAINGVAIGIVIGMVSQSRIGAVLGGLAWLLLILNMDRAFVSFSPKTRSGLNVRQGAGLAGRLLVALLVGYFSSGMVIQLFFKPDLEGRIGMLVAAADTEAERQADAAFPEIARLSAENVRLEKQILAEKFVVDDAYRRMQDQASGRIAGSPRGYGRQYLQDTLQYARKLSGWETLRDRNQATISSNNARIVALRTERDNYVASLRAANQGSANGFLRRQQALTDLQAEQFTALKWHMILLVLLITIDLLPLGYKILAPYGPYDARLEAEKELHVATLTDQTDWSRREREIRAEVREHEAEAQRKAALADIDAEQDLADERRTQSVKTRKAHIAATEQSVLTQYNDALSAAVTSGQWKDRVGDLTRTVVDRLGRKLHFEFTQHIDSGRARHRRWASKVPVPKVAELTSRPSEVPDDTLEMPPGISHKVRSEDDTLSEDRV